MLTRSNISAGRLLCLTGHLKPCPTSIRSITSQSKEISICDGTMHYVDTEKHPERAVIFLHGNPTSSFLWRRIIPHVQDVARCLAPDLIGMGRSSKVTGSMYTFEDHFKYLSKWFDSIDLPEKLNLVVHDWGSGLGFHWANLHRGRVASITHMESLVSPLKSWDEFPEGGRKIFQAMRSPAGEELVLKKNIFVERILPSSIIRKLDEKEMTSYLDPFKEPGKDRLPTLTWPREIPIESDGPANVVQFAKSWKSWLEQSSDLPKLYINAHPGFFSSFIKQITRDWPNHRVVEVKGHHFLQEDSPDEIGRALRDFLQKDVFN
ncbi:unnamed protein product [Clavelina lepadiformis]|uniref:AB hydrolase-1 domain-containing protein n=1 Tax=Clavelina lepadiformis TaxID=159417 RepID=A0ABP0FY45_CLALP